MRAARQRILVGAGAVGAAALVGVAMGARPGRQEPLESPLGGSERHFAWRGQRVFYATRGSGPRVVLVHAVHPAGSSYEWRRNFKPLAERFEVYALDLLGFGKSDRPPLRYSARLFVDLLGDFVRAVAGGSAVLAASGLSGAYAIQAAAEAPETVSALVLVGATGATRRTRPPGPGGRAAEAVFRSPLVGEAAFNAVVSKAAIRYFLRRQASAEAHHVTPEVIDYYHRASHQPGARFAPAAFAGRALNLDARQAFAGLRQPVVLLYGGAARGIPAAEGEAFRQLNPAVTLEVVPGVGAFVHEERPEVFNHVVGALEIPAGGRREAR